MSSTIFPGIEIVNIETEDSHTKKGNNDRINLLTGDTVENITPGLIKEKLGDRDKLVYDLNVKALTEKIAEMRARAFVRFKNPFEPSRFHTAHIQEIERDEKVKTYVVTIGVAK